MFHYLGLILVVITWLAGFYLVTKWRDHNLPTISQHAASSKRASFLFAVVLIGCGLGFYIWMLDWFCSHVQLGLLFKVVLTIAIACQIVAAAVPDIKGHRRTVHRYAAYTMAVLYLPLLALILTSHLSITVRILDSLIGVYMFVSFIAVALLGKGKSRYLTFQSLYIIAFQMAILIPAYL